MDPGAWVERSWAAHLGQRVPAAQLRAELTARSLPALQQATAARRPDHPAVVVDGRRVGHGELAERTAAAAGQLAAAGATGARVLLCGTVSLPYLTAYLGLLAAGATVVPVSPQLTRAELAAVADDAEPALAVAGGPCLEGMRTLADDRRLPVVADDTLGRAAGARVAFPPPPPPAAPALVAYTSGTTGRSKGAVLSHGSVAASVLGALRAWRWTRDEILLHALPLSHQHGLSGVHATVAAGSTAVLLPQFEPDRLVEHLQRERATALFAVPAMYDRLLTAGLPRPDGPLRLPISGSAPLPAVLAQRVRDWLGQLPLERYGTTESGLDLSNRVDLRVPGRVGWPLPGVEVELRDQFGHLLDPGEEGEICVRGPQVFDGYLGDPDATSRATWPGGWFRTGDLGVVDPADGSVAVVGRLKELVISGGHNVSPGEVEAVLATHPSVVDVAVVGVPDERWGEAVTAAVVLAPGARLDTAALDAHARGGLAAYKCPKRVVAVDALPRNALGKVQRAELVRRLSVPPAP